MTKSVVYEAAFTGKAREYEMSFDLDGGTVNGKTTYTVAAAYGSTIKLPTPTREGYDFQYWKGSRYYGGDSYKVEGAHAFKAVWKKKSDPKPKPSPKPDNGGSDEPSKTLAATGDSVPAMPVLATLLFSAAALAACRNKLRAGKHAR